MNYLSDTYTTMDALVNIVKEFDVHFEVVCNTITLPGRTVTALRRNHVWFVTTVSPPQTDKTRAYRSEQLMVDSFRAMMTQHYKPRGRMDKLHTMIAEAFPEHPIVYDNDVIYVVLGRNGLSSYGCKITPRDVGYNCEEFDGREIRNQHIYIHDDYVIQYIHQQAK